MGKRVLDAVIIACGVGMVIYHLAYTQYVIQGTVEHWITHLGMALLLVFLSSLRNSGRYWPLNLALVLATVGTFIYLMVCYPRLEVYGMYSANTLDLLIGIVLILLSLESTRQTFGMILPIVGFLTIAYMFLGSCLPAGLFHAMPQKWDVIIETLTVGFADTGIFSNILAISATIIFPFMVFAALVQTLGAGEFFNQFGNLIGRKSRSGPAMAAVISSGLMGSVSGQSGPNVMITGSYTIPAMKKHGYSPALSTAGPLIPPVMSAVAFLISGLTGIPYVKIVSVAVLPALLYVFSCALYVELYARKMNIRSTLMEVDFRELFLRAPLFLCPMGVIVVLFIMDFSPMFIGFWACITVLFLSLLRKKTRPSLKTLADALVKGASIASAIAVSCATLGLLVCAITNSGLGIKLPGAIGNIAGDNLLFVTLLTGVSSLILGIGMPPSASYIIVAVVLAPVLIKLGVPLLSAHLFTFYLAIFSYLTPPVALSALFASRLAGSAFFKTAIQSVRVGIGGFIVPFMVVWVGAFTGDFSEPLFAITGIAACFLTFVALQASSVGHFMARLNLTERALLMLGAVAFLAHLNTRSTIYLVVGIGILGFMFIRQKRRNIVLTQEAA
jgi:TRAP transporter 4TM/12TM fusion protein